MRLLVDDDTASATLITRVLAAGHEVVQLPRSTPDEVVFVEAQRLGLPILTANVGRKGRRDPVGLYRLALERVPHHGVIGIFRLDPFRRLSNESIVEALNRIEVQERNQPGTALSLTTIT